MPRSVFVTGCHRSGTSLLASLLHGAHGVELPLAEPRLEAQIDNPRGFFESKRIVELNDELLSLLGSEWNTPPLQAPTWNAPSFISALAPWRSSLSGYALSSRWIDKDPRLCITYPAYLHLLLKRVPLAAVVRHPLSVAASLFARDGMPLEQGLALWYLYNHHLAASLQEDDFLVAYEQLMTLDDPSSFPAVRAAILEFVERNGHSVASVSEFQSHINQRLCRHLDRSASSLPASIGSGISQRLLSCCLRSYNSVVENPILSVPSFQVAFDSLPRPVLTAIAAPSLISPTRYRHALEENLRLVSENERTRAQYYDALSQLSLIQASTTWRVTSPLRRWKDRLTRFVR